MDLIDKERVSDGLNW